MYQKAGAGIATGGLGDLAYTGVSVLWLVLAGFALIAAGAAVARVAPRFHRNRR